MPLQHNYNLAIHGLTLSHAHLCAAVTRLDHSRLPNNPLPTHARGTLTRGEVPYCQGDHAYRMFHIQHYMDVFTQTCQVHYTVTSPCLQCPLCQGYEMSVTHPQ